MRPTDRSEPGAGAAGQTPSLRLWPGVALAVLVLLVRYVLPAFSRDAAVIGALGGLLGGILLVLWWLFFSRAPWIDRLVGVGVMIGALLVMPRFLHATIASGGMGMLYNMLAVPVLVIGFVLWAVIAHRLPAVPRRVTMVVVILLAFGGWVFVRTAGVTGDGTQQFRWRWAETAEERLLAAADEDTARDVGVPVAPASLDGPAWPGFRGPERDGVVSGVHIATDWAATPPVEMWRRSVGPGWSSFAVRGGRFYTQEQRGEEETVACHDVITGELVWRHRDPVRFSETMGGVGPRATPALAGDRVYALGATGILNAVDAASGRPVWSRNVAGDADVGQPYWGFSGSPLVLGDRVVVAASGRLIAYDRATGDPRWTGPEGSESYGSPQPMTLDGVEQVVLANGNGLVSVTPADGVLLWEHAWPGTAITQPARIEDGQVLFGALGMTSGIGLRRLAVTRTAGEWSADERWTSTGLKPYYNDFVLHDGHAYGFDGAILACIALDDGERQWKGGRYGHGQLVVLADQDILLVLSETGEVALVEASPEGYTEMARFPAIEGKTWNHPVVVDDVLLVRNGQEMAAFRLPANGG